MDWTYKNNYHTGRYSKRLVAKERLEEIAQIATRARHHHEQTLPWLDEGSRILPAANYFDYMQRQNAYAAEFEQAVSAFAGIYPAVVNEARQSLNGLFNPADYPSADQISGLFTMRVDPRQDYSWSPPNRRCRWSRPGARRIEGVPTAGPTGQ